MVEILRFLSPDAIASIDAIDAIALLPDDVLPWIVFGVWVWRGVWPWLRDEYLSRQRDAMHRMVVLGEQMEMRMQAMEVRLDVVERLVAALVSEKLADETRG